MNTTNEKKEAEVVESEIQDEEGAKEQAAGETNLIPGHEPDLLSGRLVLGEAIQDVRLRN